jgi:hypothetical protein
MALEKGLKPYPQIELNLEHLRKRYGLTGLCRRLESHPTYCFDRLIIKSVRQVVKEPHIFYKTISPDQILLRSLR